MPSATSTSGCPIYDPPRFTVTPILGYPTQLIGPTQAVVSNKQLQTAHVNLIWSPVAFIDAGVEYFWGQRQTVANIKGNQQTLIGKFRVKF